MSIDIICPLYNAERYVENLNTSLLFQENVNIKTINYILTKSGDKTEEFLKKNNCSYITINKKDFSHSLVRESAAYKCSSDILVFITQDVIIKDKNWLYELTKDITKTGDIVATYSRQLPNDNGIERYTREKNYPNNSSIVSKDDVNRLGLKTFFFSDASSAVRRDIFVELNGYDRKNLPTNEDMYIAYKIIMAGYKIKYCANSVVYHSHNFSLKEVYNRYKLTGIFFKENDYLDQYGTNKAGGSLAKYVLKRAVEEKNFKVLVRYPFDMLARIIGMKVGKR